MALLLSGKIKIEVSRTTFITVPKGEHYYEIELVEPDDRPVLFRVVEKK